MEPILLHDCSALVAGRRNAHDISPDRWGAIIDTAIEHGLGPLLWRRLKQEQAEWQLSSKFNDLMQLAHREAADYSVKELAQQEINRALGRANISAMWLKGAALAQTIYPEPTSRPMVDLDVLIPDEQYQNSLRVLQNIGYHEELKPRTGILERPVVSDAVMLKISRHHRHYSLRGGIANTVLLELHTKLLDDEILPLKHMPWFWAHQQTVHLGDNTAFSTLAPEAHFLYLCAHAILQHGEYNLILLQFYDLHQLITQNALNWQIIVDQATILGWTLCVERALQLSIEYFATPIPDTVFDALLSERLPHDLLPSIDELTDTEPRWEGVRRVLKVLSLREKVNYVRAILFPTRSYMYRRYNIKLRKAVWFYYAYRWFDQGGGVVWAILKRLTDQYRRHL